MKRVIYCLMVVALLATLIIGCAPKEEAPPAPTPEPIVLKATGFLPTGDPNYTQWDAFVDKVNKEAEGKLVIDWVGGPEAIPGFEQFPAVKSGVVDIIFGCESYYGGEVTGVAYTHLTKLQPWEERDVGYYDFRVELLKEHNVYYLGRANQQFWFHIWTNKAVTTPQELAGQMIRVSATYEPFVKALGAAPVTLPGGEVYTALERGTVDGFAWCVVGIVDFGWHEVCKYVLAPRIYQMNLEVLVNLDTWNELPQEMRDLLTECQIEIEKEMAGPMLELGEKEYQRMLDAGMEAIEFTPEDTQWYIDFAYSAAWDYVYEQNPELGPQLKEFLSP